MKALNISIASAIFCSTIVLHIQAAAVNTPFAAGVAGAYTGLSEPTSGTDLTGTGSFNVAVTQAGRYSGHITIAGMSRPFFGQFSATGFATNVIKVSGPVSATMMMQLDLNGSSSSGSNSISGMILGPNWTNSLLASRNGLFSAPSSDSYAFALGGTPSSTSMPTGDSVGTLKLAKNGTVSISGMLADGTTMSMGSAVSHSGVVPVYESLYSGKGALYGWLYMTNNAAGDVHGVLKWVKSAQGHAPFYPAGFTNLARVIGSAYHPSNSVPIIASTPSALVLSGGNLSTAFRTK